MLLKVAEFSAGRFNYHKLPALGTEALLDNYDSESLRILAGLDEKTAEDEVMFYFKRSLRELGILLPEVKEAIYILSKEVACKIISGELEEYDGGRLIWDY